MKKTLLFILLFVSFLNYAQTYNNTNGYYISELIASISGTDSPDEFIELRGPANSALPANTYFVVIEGDGESSSVGKVKEVLDVSGLTFGANGFLTITFGGSSYEGNFVAASNNYTETQVTGYDGDLMDYSASYLLISASSDPNNVNVDSNKDGEFDATGDHTSWNIYDSVSSLDDDGTEFGYAQMNITTNYDTTPGIFNFPSSSAVISCNDTATSSVNIYYIARQGTSTGYSPVSDWMAGQTNSSSTRPFWKFSGSDEKNVPDALSGTTLEASTFGGPNLDPEDDATASREDLFSSKVNLSPNPTNGFINILTSEKISSIEIYNIIGKRVLSVSNFQNNKIDISNLSKGMYMMKLRSGALTATKKIIKN